MPISIGSNLEIKNNEMNATQAELFKKLNVAKAWTNTQTSSSGGTAVILVNNGDVLTTMVCNDINKCKWCHNCLPNGNYEGTAVIIDGKIYNYSNNTMNLIGTKSDYNVIMYANDINKYFAIDDSGNLWYINCSNNTETLISNSGKWTDLGLSGGILFFGINDGKLYKFTSNMAPTQICQSLTNIMKLDIYYSADNIYGLCINNGYLYHFINNEEVMIGSNNNWTDTSVNVSLWFCINNDGELFLYDKSNPSLLLKQNLSNVKKTFGIISSNNINFCLTNDNKLFFGNRLNILNGNNYGSYTDISNGIEWTDISKMTNKSNYIYATGNNKLYKIYYNAPGNNITYTQIGEDENPSYKKVEGVCVNDVENKTLGIAWAGNSISTSHTVYTTKSPQANDKTYRNEELEIYSTVQSVGNETITDEYRTYDRDVSKDTNFTAIPPATLHETVSTIDFLRITNPND